LRAGFPEDWRSGDKTGTGVHPQMPNKHNDVAVAWPTGRAPLVVSAYYEAPGHFDMVRGEDDAVLARVGRIVAQWSRGE
jgi:beta-lactamase class A